MIVLTYVRVRNLKLLVVNGLVYKLAPLVLFKASLLVFGI